jgi:hypothetical protein
MNVACGSFSGSVSITSSEAPTAFFTAFSSGAPAAAFVTPHSSITVAITPTERKDPRACPDGSPEKWMERERGRGLVEWRR